jgi:hypothetical protein
VRDLRNASQVGHLRSTHAVSPLPPHVAAAADKLIAEFAAATD